MRCNDYNGFHDAMRVLAGYIITLSPFRGVKAAFTFYFSKDLV